jgi:hypothetical protein
MKERRRSCVEDVTKRVQSADASGGSLGFLGLGSGDGRGVLRLLLVG